MSLAFVVSQVAFYWLFSEMVVFYEMWVTGATLRAELADDFGLGILGLLVALPGSVLGALVVAWVVWNRVPK